MQYPYGVIITHNDGSELIDYRSRWYSDALFHAENAVVPNPAVFCRIETVDFAANSRRAIWDRSWK